MILREHLSNSTMHVSEDAYSYAMADLPEGWVTAKLSDIYIFEGGGTPDRSYPAYWNGEIPWASVKDIKDKFIDDTIE